jgi:hypothetical protein
MFANVIEGNYAGAAAIKDAPAEIPSAATLAALDNLGSPITAASVSARRRRTPRLRCFRSRADSRVGHLVERCRRRRLRVRASAQGMTAHPSAASTGAGHPRSTRQSRPATWRRPAPRRPRRRARRPADAGGRGGGVGRRVGRGSRAGCGTARWSARRARPHERRQGWEMMRRQARRSGLVMGFDTHMIAGSRACPHQLGSLTRPSPARQARTLPRPCLTP